MENYWNYITFVPNSSDLDFETKNNSIIRNLDNNLFKHPLNSNLNFINNLPHSHCFTFIAILNFPSFNFLFGKSFISHIIGNNDNLICPINRLLINRPISFIQNLIIFLPRTSITPLATYSLIISSLTPALLTLTFHPPSFWQITSTTLLLNLLALQTNNIFINACIVIA